ncbi:MAG: DUF4325 domain-containing protein [Alphaproteobacteria bacterium]|nr:DUF4325 domain-containing protein [Alphaproteobacteria bacterium]
MNEVRITDIIGTQNAILHKFGLQVFEVIKPYISSNQPITLSFEGLRNITSGFCNASIGKAFLELSQTAKLLTISGIDNHPNWQETIQDSIALATTPDKIKFQEEAISELFCS